MQEYMLTIAEKDFVQSNLHVEVTALALQLGRFSNMDARKILRQVAGYQVMKKKVPSWYDCPDLLFPASLSLEQCSSETTARYKTSLCTSLGSIRTMADLTGGLGIDCTFMADGREKVLYVERQAELCELARNNFKELGLPQIEVMNGDGPEILKTIDFFFDLIFLDPARRNLAGGKVVFLSDCEPDLTEVKPLLLSKATFVLVKLSPMLDISMALKQLPETAQIHVVSVDGECKELLFLLKSDVCTTEPEIHCVNIISNGMPQDFVFTGKEEQNAKCVYAETPASYLYEPNASILKAGAFSMITKAFNVKKLHPNSHLYTSHQYLPDFPGRSFLIESFFHFHSKDLKQNLNGATKANITVRNFPNTVAEIRKKTGLKDGGEIFIFATTLNDGKKVFIRCRKPKNN